MVYEMKERKRERKFFTSLSNKIEKFSFFQPQYAGICSVFELKNYDHVNALHKISHFRKTCAALFFIYCKFD